MAEYIKFPTYPTQDLLRGVEAISPYQRINQQQSHQDEKKKQQSEHDQGTDQRARRRFISLRRVINELKESNPINKVDFGTAHSELHNLGLTVLEEDLLQQLLQLKIPLDSIENLRQQIEANRSSLKLDNGRPINKSDSELFPNVSEGLSEYNLKIEGLKIDAGSHSGSIIDAINEKGHCIVEHGQLRLTFSRLGPEPETANEQLKLKISVLLAIIETDEAGRRAILYQRADDSYALYADKLINLSI